MSNLEVGFLKEPMIHEDKKPLSAWLDRHNRYSSSQAAYLWNQERQQLQAMQGLTFSLDRRLYLKEKFRQTIWNKLPVGVRPFLLFMNKYILRLGFLDGVAGFIYHFLHEFWFPLMVDAKLLELRLTDNNSTVTIHK